ncbi:MAG: hypothetical protein AUI14_01585 [Actinobacteria bacterium 13_2_20CM_2_71_6]|nr:MAG: hypothetical protein AUI14_01585 [Actinobacteria bacterium 13_2_20CM_2_71_6]
MGVHEQHVQLEHGGQLVEPVVQQPRVVPAERRYGDVLGIGRRGYQVQAPGDLGEQMARVVVNVLDLAVADQVVGQAAAQLGLVDADRLVQPRCLQARVDHADP